MTGAKAMWTLSCPRQSLTAVEASSSQREGQGKGPRPVRSTPGVSVRKETGEGVPFASRHQPSLFFPLVNTLLEEWAPVWLQGVRGGS